MLRPGRAIVMYGLLSASAWAGAAEQCRLHDDPAEAAAACTRWIESGGLNGAQLSDALSNRGYWLYRTGDLDAAMGDLDRAISLSPDNAEAYYHLGLVLEASGAIEAAVQQYSRALSLVPGWPAVLVERGNAFHREGDYAGAVADYVAALGQGADDALIYSNLGTSYAQMGADEQALAAQNSALLLDPADDGAYVARAETLERLGRFEAAVADYERALSMDFAFWAPRMKAQMQDAELWGGPLDGTDSADFRAALRACVVSPDC